MRRALLVKSASVPAIPGSPESQEVFIARGMAAREEAQRTGEYFVVDEVLDGLDAVAEENARARDT